MYYLFFNNIVCCWVKTPHSLIILVHLLEEHTASIIRVGVSQVMKVAGYTEEEGKEMAQRRLECDFRPMPWHK